MCVEVHGSTGLASTCERASEHLMTPEERIQQWLSTWAPKHALHLQPLERLEASRIDFTTSVL
jgi:hypothetical protein